MNINLLLNSQILSFLNQLYKYKETEKSVKETEKVENYITYSFNLNVALDIISNDFLFFNYKEINSRQIKNYSTYFNLLEYINNNKNSKVIFYYAKSNKEKLSQTKKILTFLNKEKEFVEIHKLISKIDSIIRLKEYLIIPDNLESYINTEGELSNSYFEKVNKFLQKYFNDKGEIRLDDELEEFEGIEFIELPDISNYNKEYIIFFLLKKLSEMYENIPILYVDNFDYIFEDISPLKEKDDLIIMGYFSHNIFFKNIKKDKLDKILNFINENTYIDEILNEFYEKKKKKINLMYNRHYDFKN